MNKRVFFKLILCLLALVFLCGCNTWDAVINDTAVVTGEKVSKETAEKKASKLKYDSVSGEKLLEYGELIFIGKATDSDFWKLEFDYSKKMDVDVYVEAVAFEVTQILYGKTQKAMDVKVGDTVKVIKTVSKDKEHLYVENQGEYLVICYETDYTQHAGQSDFETSDNFRSIMKVNDGYVYAEKSFSAFSDCEKSKIGDITVRKVPIADFSKYISNTLKNK